jgi:O-antigen ligase
MELFLKILGIFYFVFALWDLEWAVVLLPLFFPAYLLRFDVFGIPFPLVEVFIYAVCTAWAVRFLYERFFVKRAESRWARILLALKGLRRQREKRFEWQLWIPVALLVLAAVISTAIAPTSVVMMDGNTVFFGRKVALGILKSWIVAPILMFLLFRAVLKKTSDFEKLFNFYTVSAVFLGVWALIQVATHQYITPDARASGPFNSANYLALYIVPALFYSFARLKDFVMAHRQNFLARVAESVHGKDKKRMDFLKLICFVLSFGMLMSALLFTKCYAAFFALLVAVAIWLLFEHFSWKTFGMLFGVALSLFAFVVALDPTKWQLFFQVAIRTSSAVRVEIYQIALGLVFANPVLGIGLGMFPATYQLQGPAILGHNPYEWNMLHPHNIFLAFWLNLGILGLAAFIWILFICFKKVWGHLRASISGHSDSILWLRSVSFFMLLLIIIHGFFDTPFFKNDLALLFWLVVSGILLPFGPI